MFLGDFHIHSGFSDGKLAIPEIIDLYGSRGFGAIAITDHVAESKGLIGKTTRHLGLTLTPATFPLYQAILASETLRAWKTYRMVVFTGLEFSKNAVSDERSAHVLGIGMTDFAWADAEPIALARLIRRQGGLAVAAHPVHTGKAEKQTYYLWKNRENLSREFDAWEVSGGTKLFAEVLESPLPKIANSDFHARRHLSSWKTVFDCARHPASILDAVRNQDLGFTLYEEVEHVRPYDDPAHRDRAQLAHGRDLRNVPDAQAS